MARDGLGTRKREACIEPLEFLEQGSCHRGPRLSRVKARCKSSATMWQDGSVRPDEEGAAREEPTLVRRLGAWDGALITIGAVLGSGIFLTTGDIARRLPHGGLILLLWAAGGLVTLAGALSY